jgi:hypothetical protein
MVMRRGPRPEVRDQPASPVAHVAGVPDLTRLSNAELDALERFTNARLAAQAVQEHGD